MLFNIPPESLIKYTVAFFIAMILFIMNMSNRSKIKKMKNKYYKFMNGLSGLNIEQLLETCIEKINETTNKNIELEKHINNIERTLLQCIQKVGVVRFNAFENVGSDLSFSIALLDNNDNGLVLSGIYSRDSSATYGKPILAGKSRYALSVEEIQALDIAKKSSRESVYS